MPTSTLTGTIRVILGVHYPIDVLAGALIGAVMGHWVAQPRRASPS